MRFSARFASAVHALIIINEFSNNQKVTSDVIAEAMGSTPALIRVLLGKLKTAGFISIDPGKGRQGTRMARPLEQITLLEVYNITEPNNEKEIIETHNRIAARCPSGLMLNDIMSEQMINALNVAKMTLAHITLGDILVKLEEKEKVSPYEDPRVLLYNFMREKANSEE